MRESWERTLLVDHPIVPEFSNDLPLENFAQQHDSSGEAWIRQSGPCNSEQQNGLCSYQPVCSNSILPRNFQEHPCSNPGLLHLHYDLFASDDSTSMLSEQFEKDFYGFDLPTNYYSDESFGPEVLQKPEAWRVRQPCLVSSLESKTDNDATLDLLSSPSIPLAQQETMDLPHRQKYALALGVDQRRQDQLHVQQSSPGIKSDEPSPNDHRDLPKTKPKKKTRKSFEPHRQTSISQRKLDEELSPESIFPSASEEVAHSRPSSFGRDEDLFESGSRGPEDQYSARFSRLRYPWTEGWCEFCDSFHQKQRSRYGDHMMSFHGILSSTRRKCDNPVRVMEIRRPRTTRPAGREDRFTTEIHASCGSCQKWRKLTRSMLNETYPYASSWWRHANKVSTGTSPEFLSIWMESYLPQSTLDFRSGLAYESRS